MKRKKQHIFLRLFITIIFFSMFFFPQSVVYADQSNNTNNCDHTIQFKNNNANHNCNNNSNNNNNVNTQYQSQEQNNNQTVNIAMPAPAVVPSFIPVTSLPSTGAQQDIVFGLFALIPIAIKLRQLA